MFTVPARIEVITGAVAYGDVEDYQLFAKSTQELFYRAGTALKACKVDWSNVLNKSIAQGNNLTFQYNNTGALAGSLMYYVGGKVNLATSTPAYKMSVSTASDTAELALTDTTLSLAHNGVNLLYHSDANDILYIVPETILSGDVTIEQLLYDENGSEGSAGEILGSTGGGVEWKNAITSYAELTSGLASTDELLVSDAGTTKKMDVSVLQTYLQNSLNFNSEGVDYKRLSSTFSASGSDKIINIETGLTTNFIGARVECTIDHGAGSGEHFAFYITAVMVSGNIQSQASTLLHLHSYGSQFAGITPICEVADMGTTVNFRVVFRGLSTSTTYHYSISATYVHSGA